jgi:hypothetical protein
MKGELTMGIITDVIGLVTVAVKGAKFGIGLAEGTADISDGMSELIGTIINKSISKGIDMVDYKDEV